jgi:NCS1 family nucleobase:cation symporter-1
MYLGFFVSILVFGGESLATVMPFMNKQVGIVILAAVSLAATIWGYSLIHAYARIMTWGSGIVLAMAFVWAFVLHPLPTGFFHGGGATLGGFISTVSVSAVWQIAYAPYVSDYSRYMPAETGEKPAFWMSYWGTTLGSILPMLLGAGTGLLLPNESDPVVALTTATAGISLLVVAVFSVGVAATNAMNLYCGSLCTLTIAQTFRPRFQARGRSRVVVASCLATLAIVIALVAGDGFVATYNKFLTLLLGSLVPWTAVNLVDYYLVRHGDYEVEDFFKADGGRYGRYNWPAICCYIVGVLVQLPFMVLGDWVGPMAARLGGVDISFVVGLAVVSPLYYFTDKWAAGRRRSPLGARVREAVSSPE